MQLRADANGSIFGGGEAWSGLAQAPAVRRVVETFATGRARVVEARERSRSSSSSISHGVSRSLWTGLRESPCCSSACDLCRFAGYYSQ